MAIWSILNLPTEVLFLFVCLFTAKTIWLICIRYSPQCITKIIHHNWCIYNEPVWKNWLTLCKTWPSQDALYHQSHLQNASIAIGIKKKNVIFQIITFFYFQKLAVLISAPVAVGIRLVKQAFVFGGWLASLARFYCLKFATCSFVYLLTTGNFMS